MIMVKEDRHKLILDTLMAHESIQVAELSSLLGVSAVTIRKDLTELEKKKMLYRSHGRAILINPFISNRHVSEKEGMAIEQKRQIGMAAAKLITKDDSIIIASGTTVQAFARCIVPDQRLTVISASLKVSEVLGADSRINVIQLGGSLRHSSLSVVGSVAGDMLSEISCSKLFLGVDGIDFDFGITTTDLREAELNRLMMRAAEKVIVLADSSKFRRKGFGKIANLSDVDLVITDSGVSNKVAQSLEDLGIELIVVDVP